MLPETDMEGLKRLANTLLQLDIQKTPMSPLVVKHPFTDSGIVGVTGKDGHLAIANLVDNKEDLKTWRKQTAGCIDQAESPFQVVVLITKPYLLGFLKFARPYLSQKDFSEMLADAWIRSEAPNDDPNLSKPKLLAMFRKADPNILMNEDERKILQGLENPVTVYRGVTSYNAKNVQALSWTLDEKVAKWFAHRYGEQGTVYQARIHKDDIYAVFTGRNESEVIVDPKHLVEIEPVEDLSMDLKM